MRTSSFIFLIIIIVLLGGAAYYFLTGANNPNPASLYGDITPSAPNTGVSTTATTTNMSSATTTHSSTKISTSTRAKANTARTSHTTTPAPTPVIASTSNPILFPAPPPVPVTPSPTNTSLNVVTVATSSAHGNYLVATNGMTLYTFSKDSSDTSNCTATCTLAWPPYTVLSSAPPTTGDPSIMGPLGTIPRPDDGSIQVTYRASPLYFFNGDSVPGDTNGAGIPDWKIAKP